MFWTQSFTLWAQIILSRPKDPYLDNFNVRRLTPATVAKVAQDVDRYLPDASEANALNLVLADTSIPAPRVWRVVKFEWTHIIIQDYIKGPSLDQVWSTHSMWQKIHVAFTLRRYVCQLRRRLKASPVVDDDDTTASNPPTDPNGFHPFLFFERNFYNRPWYV
ncbi:hypothetical protein D9757_011873 [Collybiopsis confluens]|uniref:Uncharacterized protein n=1 Tax=Collybiopsis confluens TaxID=2823264 RepID=A0A8H5LR83_9AGAR|nr:hypothetical protein D9757_011873 [Collybiopsis confluens]